MIVHVQIAVPVHVPKEVGIAHAHDGNGRMVNHQRGAGDTSKFNIHERVGGKRSVG